MRGLISACFALVFTVTTPLYARPAQESPARTLPARTLNDIVYSQPGGIDLMMDASLPESGRPTAAVILVHGGGWVRGDRRVDVRPLFKPLADAGFAWFSISYRLATNVTDFGVAIDDVEAAVKFVKSHAADYNLDPNRIALVGESAGGQLAAMAVLRGGEAASVKAVVAFYTPFDLVSLLRNSSYIPAQIRTQVIGTPWERLVMAGVAQLSPVDNVKPDMPPFLLIHGTEDALVPFEQSEAMCNRMHQVGASCQLVPVRGAGHGIRWWTAAEQRQADTKMIDWLNQKLSPTAAEANVFY